MIVVHPMTVGADGGPMYKADDFRRTNNVWFSPSDPTKAGSPCVSGVRNESNSPVCSINGLTVTVKSHSGVIFPFNGGSPYTYYMDSKESLTLANISQHWKIALVITDPTAGIGTSPSAKLTALPIATPDNTINGLVLATVKQGILNDIAPRLLIGTTIQVADTNQLQTIKTTDGQRALVKSNGLYYIMVNGVWTYEFNTWRKTGTVSYVENPSKLKIDVLEKWGNVVHMSGSINEGNAVPVTFTYGTVPIGFRPIYGVHLTQGGFTLVNGAVAPDGAIKFQCQRDFASWIDACWITNEA